MNVKQLEKDVEARKSQLDKIIAELGDDNVVSNIKSFQFDATADTDEKKLDAVKALMAEYKELKAKYDEAVGFEGEKGSIKAQNIIPFIPATTDHPIEKKGADKIPAQVRKFGKGSLKAFTDDEFGTAAEKAYGFTQFVKATQHGDRDAIQYITDKGIRAVKAASEGINSAGGFLVPDQFVADLINNVERYGVARSLARVLPMSSDSITLPRKTGGLTVYGVSEGGAGTQSDMTFSNVKGVAKDWMVLNKTSNQLSEDSAIAYADMFLDEAGRVLAEKEDDCYFNGTGTSTYQGITGVTQSLLDVDGTIGNVKGLYVGTGNLYSELVLADFNNTVALLPEWADTGNTKWVVSKKFWGSVMFKLLSAAGGVTGRELIDGYTNAKFLGYPVVISQKMPKTEANSQVCALLGDFSQGSFFFDRKQYTLATSEHALNAFEQNQTAFRITTRWDINVYDVGDTTDAGAIVGLITAAS